MSAERELIKDSLLLLKGVCVDNAIDCLNDVKRIYGPTYRQYIVDDAELDLQLINNLIAKIEDYERRNNDMH